ncbi:hypothetical protein C0Q70_08301 [Pomacea canaliculata]|uniref:EF-hand domain-containing protein n=1 Tax=Pomacea canaliculata TaxID=400727 RepID=A0A2T7PHG8_POMCA|nr:uncharacterized protein LOC112563025 [Pomacea canaliculata]PVD32854.1 hypothetical protein C0Q70_08301 [Pomacea canaliculata]
MSGKEGYKAPKVPCNALCDKTPPVPPKMNAFFILACFLGAAAAQLHTQCHSNAQQLREVEVVALVADIVDRNEDNIITVGEFVVGFADILQYQLPLSEGVILGMTREALVALAAAAGLHITKEEFVTRWHARFGDSMEFARATFEAYDTNHDGGLSVFEIESIVDHVLEREDNGDGKVSGAEFRAYLLWVYGPPCA